IVGKLRHRRPPDAAEHGCHDPVQRRDEQVLPLVPDGGCAGAVHGARERDRHLGVGPDAEALGDHHPWPEPPTAEKVVGAAAHAVADDETDAGNEDEIGGENGPVETRDRHGVPSSLGRDTDRAPAWQATSWICSSPVAGSHSASTVPSVVMPMYVAGIVDAIATTPSSVSPAKRTVLAMARSSVTLDPARYGVPGNDTRPSSPSSQSTAPMV